MIEEIGTIVAIAHEKGMQKIWVETEIKTTCNSCQVQTNCGTSVVAKAFAPKKQNIELFYDLPVKVGQKVKLGIPEETLLSASLQVYLLPLFGLIVGAMLASWLMPFFALESELWVVLSGFVMAILVFLLIRHRMASSGNQHFCPTLLDVFPHDDQTISITNL